MSHKMAFFIVTAVRAQILLRQIVCPVIDNGVTARYMLSCRTHTLFHTKSSDLEDGFSNSPFDPVLN
jgi:hypothetical protein